MPQDIPGHIGTRMIPDFEGRWQTGFRKLGESYWRSGMQIFRHGDALAYEDPPHTVRTMARKTCGRKTSRALMLPVLVIALVSFPSFSTTLYVAGDTP